MGGSRFPVWAVGLVAGLAVVLLVGGLVIALAMRPQGGAGMQVSGVRTSGEAAIGGDFALINQDGEPFTQADLDGRLSLVFFGYTFCPDACPVSMQTIRAAMERLPEDGRDQIQPVFITVDPERDTVEKMAQYAQTSGFPDNLEALTGPPEAVDQAKDAYRVYSARAGEGDAYLVDHSTYIYLMDRDGRLVTVFSHNESPETIARSLSNLIG